LKRLLITADDYGLHPAINRGIEELAASGAIDRVSIMAHRDAYLETLPALLKTHVELGIHFVMVEEYPLLNTLDPAQLNKGRLPKNYSALFRLLIVNPTFAKALALEAKAQLERLQGLGIALRHANSHQHVHLFPPLWRALKPLFEKSKLVVRAAKTAHLGPLKQVLVEGASAFSWKLWPLHGGETIHPLGIELAGSLSAPRLRATAADLQTRLRGDGAAELVVHPGHEDSTLLAQYKHWRYSWEGEYQALASGSVREILEAIHA